VHTFFHELSHLIFAIPLLSLPTKIVIADKTTGSGYVEYKTLFFMRKIHNHLVALAPYFFVPLSFLFAFLYHISLPDNWVESLYYHNNLSGYLLFFTGFTYSYHLYTILKQARPYQSDFMAVGYAYGIIFSLMIHLLLLIMLMSLIEF
jgi:hypothetical protein